MQYNVERVESGKSYNEQTQTRCRQQSDRKELTKNHITHSAFNIRESGKLRGITEIQDTGLSRNRTTQSSNPGLRWKYGIPLPKHPIDFLQS